MRLTQGMFSFLPDLSDAEIEAQLEYFIDHGWSISIEYTDDPHPRNSYWEMWGAPSFDLADPRPVMDALAELRAVRGDVYVRIVAFDASKGWESPRASFIVDRPADEPGFALDRVNGAGRTQRYATRAYAAREPAGARYRG